MGVDFWWRFANDGAVKKERTMKGLLGLALIAASMSEPEKFPWWMAVILVLSYRVFIYFFGREKR